MSDTQLARRQRDGLIAHARVRPLGRGRGSVSLYPVGTGALLVRTLELAGPGRPSFEKLAWRVWWEDGGELVPLVRDRLRRDAAISSPRRMRASRPPYRRWNRRT
jgi:hypothetical protein